MAGWTDCKRIGQQEDLNLKPIMTELEQMLGANICPKSLTDILFSEKKLTGGEMDPPAGLQRPPILSKQRSAGGNRKSFAQPSPH